MTGRGTMTAAAPAVGVHANLSPVWIGLLGFKEARTTAGIAAGVVEVAALLVLAGGASSLGRLDWEQRDE
jgi:hypothetical protein